MWVVSSYVQPFAQSNSGLFEHQMDYNKYVIEDGKIVDYIVDQNNWYPNLTTGDMGYNKNMRNTCNRGLQQLYQQRPLPCQYGVSSYEEYYLRLHHTRSAHHKGLYPEGSRILQRRESFFIYNGAGKYKIDPEVEGGVSEGLYGFGRNHPPDEDLLFRPSGNILIYN